MHPRPLSVGRYFFSLLPIPFSLFTPSSRSLTFNKLSLTMKVSRRSTALSSIITSLLLPTSSLANIVSSSSAIAESYDFVICGGGLAGLVLASRLSEDSNHTVLVLEAGASGDAVKEQIDVPANAYYSSLLGTSYDWQFTTQPQDGAGNRSISWPRGKVLGGSTAVNGEFILPGLAEFFGREC